MIDREKVISDFEHEVFKANSEGWDFVDLTTEDAKKILELLKEQVPRLLTLEEVKHLNDLRDGAVWIEVPGGLFPAVPEITAPHVTYFVAVELHHYRGYFDNDYYGKTWRCWTARPTVEQRNEAAWDD